MVDAASPTGHTVPMTGATPALPSQPLLTLAPKTASGGKIRASRFAPGRIARKPAERLGKGRLRSRTRVGASILANTVGNLVAEGIASAGRSRGGVAQTGAGDGTAAQPQPGEVGGSASGDAQPGDIVVTALRRADYQVSSDSLFLNAVSRPRSKAELEFDRQLAASPLASQLVKPVQMLDRKGIDALLGKVGYDPVGQGEWGNSGGVPGWKLLKLHFDIMPDALSFGNAVASDLGLFDGLNRPLAWNNAADAARHTYLSIRVDRELGSTTGKAILDAHERSGGNDPGETLMDLTNNHNGRILSRIFPNMPAATLATRALNAGLLQTQPIASGPTVRVPNMSRPKTY